MPNVSGVENHCMNLRKSSGQSMISQRRAFNEIGNVHNSNLSVCVTKQFINENVKPVNKLAQRHSCRNSIATKGLRPILKPAEPVKLQTVRLTRSQIQNSPKCAIVTQAMEIVRQNESDLPRRIKSINNPEQNRRVPRLTLKPPNSDSPSKVNNNTDHTKKRRSCFDTTVLRINQSLRIQSIAQIRTLTDTNKELSINDKYDIDLHYKGCLWMVTCYAQDICVYLQQLECKVEVKPTFLPEIDLMRTNLVDWLANIYQRLHLLQETFQLSVHILDMYMENSKDVTSNKLQLIALCCLSLGIKYEEIVPTPIRELLSLTKQNFTRQQFIEMEETIFQVVGYQVGHPVPIQFLRRFNMAARCGRVQHSFGKYLIDLAQLDSYLANERASLLAAAAVYIAICIMKTEVNSQWWNPVLCYYTQYSYEDIRPIVSRLADIATKHDCLYNAIQKKYSTDYCYNVSTKVEQQESLLQKLI